VLAYIVPHNNLLIQEACRLNLAARFAQSAQAINFGIACAPTCYGISRSEVHGQSYRHAPPPCISKVAQYLVLSQPMIETAIGVVE